MALFSRRHRPPPDRLMYDVPEQVRLRLLHTLDHLLQQEGLAKDLDGLLAEVEGILHREYGVLHASSYAAARRSDHPVAEHFFCCPHEYALV